MEVPLYEKKHQDLLNFLALNKYPFVVYRQPGEIVDHLFIPSIVETLTSAEQLSGREGFLFAPFIPNQPFIFFSHPLSPPIVSLMQEPMPCEEDFPLESERDSHAQLINQTMDYIHLGEAHKVVISGIFRQAWGGPGTSAKLYETLCTLYPEAYCYLAWVPGFGLWAGASPEVLIRWKNNVLQTMALAGTLPTANNTDWRLKEAEEHNWVVAYIDHSLRNHIGHQPEIKGPEEIKAGTARHLCTRFQVQSSQTQALQAAFALHPTPAVCGFPQKTALQFILKNETHKRELYTGFAGCVSNHQIDLFVNLRCAKLGPAQAYIFVGGGITRYSVAEDEWDEINLKRATLSAALLPTLTTTQTYRNDIR